MRVLIVDHDARVRRAMSALLDAAEHVVAGTATAARLAPDLDLQLIPDIVVLEIDPRRGTEDLDVVAELVRRARVVIAVCSAPVHRAAALAAGAVACLDKDGRFVEDLTEAVRTAASGSANPPAA